MEMPSLSNTKERKILAGNMWLTFNMEDPNRRYQSFLMNAERHIPCFMDSLLLYDQVVIPTEDFMNLSTLVGVFGQRAIIELLERNDIRFVLLEGSFCYYGNGNGLGFFSMKNQNNAVFPAIGDIEGSVDRALGGLQIGIVDPALKRNVVLNTMEIRASDIKDFVRDETYSDVLNSPFLINFISLKENFDLNNLGSNQVRLYGGFDRTSNLDAVDLLLSVCFSNLEIKLAEITKCFDISSLNTVGQTLKAKTQKWAKETQFQSMTLLRELDQVPNLFMYLQKEKNIQRRGEKLLEVLKHKYTKEGKNFRDWFHDNCANNPKEMAKAYIDLIREIPSIDRIPARVIRFIVVTLLGGVPVIGQIASFCDSFLLSKVLKGNSPRIFIENLNQAVRE